MKALVIHNFFSFEENVHLRRHPGIERGLTNMAARQASSLAAAPAYFNYALCDSFNPSFWPANLVTASTAHAAFVSLSPMVPPPALPAPAFHRDRASWSGGLGPLSARWPFDPEREGRSCGSGLGYVPLGFPLPRF